ncbi:C-4 sterol methyl oxidase [Handroanthus impetiginosus]|uniref:C-4 sterol methyl oxidase n=1 Tax=Handroanthus impetiginosus TaxID=429701 RepID=A0A2G9I4I0_9LAMI|nr:C-4 sterol methyl oxidase [Handroanthus impetiginosus]
MLQYQTLEEAAASLGRNLTSAETLWFKYSARKSDFILYGHNTFFLILFYTIAPLPYVIMELMRSKKIEKYKLQPNVKNSSADMLDCYKKVIYSFLTAVLPLQILSYPAFKNAGIRTSLPLPSGSEIFWQLLAYFIIEDFAHYWLHRMLHTKWGYEKIHRVHHEYTAPIVFAAPYAHWAELIILGFASFVGPLIIPGHIITYWTWFVVRQMEAIEVHSMISRGVLRSTFHFMEDPFSMITIILLEKKVRATFHQYSHIVTISMEPIRDTGT